MTNFKGKVAIVTGASSGIGRATARALAAEGASVVVADVQDEAGQAVADELAAGTGGALYVHVDVSDPGDVAAMVAATLERFGRLDIAVNNAGIEGEQAPVADMAIEHWNQVIGVNLTGVFLCMRAEIPAMTAGDGGTIVNISSIAGLKGFAGLSHYVASKHGVIGLTRAAALETGALGIRVAAICPGVIDTEMVSRATEANPELLAGLLQVEPLGRLGHPEEIADAVRWICSDGAGFLTGSAIVIDGGQLA
jgi:NAD(P)-dependent dehydrogenase (short-subunit alcohol dehydrogenase family)